MGKSPAGCSMHSVARSAVPGPVSGRSLIAFRSGIYVESDAVDGRPKALVLMYPASKRCAVRRQALLGMNDLYGGARRTATSFGSGLRSTIPALGFGDGWRIPGCSTSRFDRVSRAPSRHRHDPALVVLCVGSTGWTRRASKRRADRSFDFSIAMSRGLCRLLDNRSAISALPSDLRSSNASARQCMSIRCAERWRTALRIAARSARSTASSTARGG